ncbi:MAG TPA: maleylpyruvate isomerase family mycothiol-dependent enzyme [Candidatus Dormibacteraeota bacterium]
MPNSQAATIDLIAGCCARIEAVCAGLDDAGWHCPTALPAWDVQDVVAHLGSVEGMLIGRDEPPHQPAVMDHVRNPLGALNEGMVDRRRGWSGAEVLDEFREVAALRLDELRALDEEALARQVPSPRGGTMSQGDFLGMRLWDYFVHEMDICDALGLAFPVDTPAGRRVLDEMLSLLPRAVAKGGVGEGGVVVLELTDPLRRSAVAEVRDGRGRMPDTLAGEATLHLRASPAVFLRIGSGRREPGEAIAGGAVHVDGDTGLAAAVLAALNVVP